MPQLAPVTLNGYTTYSHVFNPVDIREGVSGLAENLALGANELTQSVLPKGRATQGKRRFRVPLVRTDSSGVPYIAGYATGLVQYDLPEIATADERKLVVGLVANGASETAWKTSVVDRVNYY